MTKALEPCRFLGMELRNRIVRSATYDPLGAPDGSVTAEQAAYYRTLAENQVGLIITGMANVSEDGAGALLQNGIFDDRFIPGHELLTKAVHEASGRVVLQINHAGAQGIGPMNLSPSGIAPRIPMAPCREMTEGEMERVAADFASAAVRAQKAGYDGVQVHCAHGYLLSEFLNPHFNRRADEYGGSAENRFRFPGLVLRAVKKAVGDYPVLIKINSNAEENDEAYAKDLPYFAGRCAELGVGAVEVSGFDFTPQGKTGKHNYYLERAAAARRASGIPVILVGGVRTPEDMDKALSSGVDLVAMSRPFICEPDFLLRLKSGQAASSCKNCSRCFALLSVYPKKGILCVLHKPAGQTG